LDPPYRRREIWETDDPAYASSRGRVPVRLSNGIATERAGVDVVAPTQILFGYGPANFYQQFATDGTSMAAPAVSGAAAQLKHAMYALRGPQDARHLFVNMLLLADGYDFPAGPDARRVWGADSVSGMGRTVLHAPRAEDFPSGAWDWNWSWFTLYPGQVRTGILTQRSTQHRYVFTWFGDNTDALADIDVRAYYRCGAAPRVEVASQIDFDVRNRLQVSGSSIPIGCQYEIDVIAYNIPAGQSRTLWEAWLWHNEPPE
jgi:hypothetical protein